MGGNEDEDVQNGQENMLLGQDSCGSIQLTVASDLVECLCAVHY